MTGAARRFVGARRGAIAIVFAILAPALLCACVLAADVGTLYLDRRALQKAVDAAALAAARRPATAEAEARRMLAANGAADARFEIGFGHYAFDAAVRPERRFEARPSLDNAVSVAASRTVPLYFARLFGREIQTIGATARAAIRPEVSFSIGSRLASVEPNLLPPLLGADLGLSVLDYRALLRANAPLGAMLARLAATTGLPPGATVGAVLDRPVRLRLLLGASADALAELGDAGGAAAARQAGRSVLAGAIDLAPGEVLRVDDRLLVVPLDGPGRALSGRVSVLGLLSAAIGRHDEGNAVAARLALPGIATAALDLLLGEGLQRLPPIALGNAPIALGTAQARLRLALRTGGLGASLGAELDLPLEAVLAGARVELVSASCSGDPARREVRLLAYPGLLRVSLGRSSKPLEAIGVEDSPARATILSLPLLRVEAASTVAVRQDMPVPLVFRGTEIGDGTTRTARTKLFASSLVASLFGEASLTVHAGPLGLAPALPWELKGVLATLAAPIDDLLGAALSLAGIGLGEVDVRVDDLVCSDVRLVG
ncbi:hypothetical protein GCM10011390_40960 [Aureimonas endophytica]|uniref:DUF2134 domain-containing protein n=1 Tax=Aureimonas endophytica TaxID=2027858 RepID=A0A916ZX78_9HYPH|nr:TadG family pilus assembly protein [Aureimonas endophytica]GGE17628.1 hypothetical protein GCM10011390_40960 [Aureimonas endophytica]